MHCRWNLGAALEALHQRSAHGPRLRRRLLRRTCDGVQDVWRAAGAWRRCARSRHAHTYACSEAREMTESTIHGPALSGASFGPLTLGGFFREVCRRNGDREALVFYPPGKPVVRYTYAQMWDEAFAVARSLVARGVTKETRVGLLAT